LYSNYFSTNFDKKQKEMSKSVKLQEEIEDLLYRDGELSIKNQIIYEVTVYLNGVSKNSPTDYKNNIKKSK